MQSQRTSKTSPLWALASALLPLFPFLGCGDAGVGMTEPSPEPVRTIDGGSGPEPECSTNGCNPSEDPNCTDCACEPAPMDMPVAPQKWLTVACLCGAVPCPTFSEAWAGSFVAGCTYRRSGCGVDEFAFQTFANLRRYQFVAGTMVAGEFMYDVTAPPCDRFGYQGGELMDLTECADFTECLNCPGEVSTVDRPLCEADG